MEKAAKVLIPRVIALLRALRLSRQNRWLAVQKPFGFGGLNAVYGAAIAEMEYTEARLLSYLDGEVAVLEELTQENPGFRYADDKKSDFRFI